MQPAGNCSMTSEPEAQPDGTYSPQLTIHFMLESHSRSRLDIAFRVAHQFDSAHAAADFSFSAGKDWLGRNLRRLPLMDTGHVTRF